MIKENQVKGRYSQNICLTLCPQTAIIMIQRDGSLVIHMKKLLSIVVLGALSVTGLAVTVEKTANLNVYYPEYTRIDLVCGQMPKAAQKDVEFCCEAAFTGELLEEFKHSNVADNHICSGELKNGYSCKANNGGFVYKVTHALYLDIKDLFGRETGRYSGICG